MNQQITIISGDVGNPGGGQSRFVINLALGLAGLGAQVRIAAPSVRPAALAVLKDQGVRVDSLGWNSADPIVRFHSLTSSARLGQSLALLAQTGGKSDWYLVISDETIGAVDFISSGRTAYISNGDLSLLFLNPGFYLDQAVWRNLLSATTARNIRRNGRRARKFDLLLANSSFTRNFMSMLYGIPFAAVVYPPVDLSHFNPSKRTTSTRYAMAVARNASEYGAGALAEIAKKIPLKVAGGARIPGAQTLGFLSEQELETCYASAEFLVFPSPSEFFGYPVAESLASGTPVLAFDCGGPAELVEHGKSGWLEPSDSALVSSAASLFGSGFSADFRIGARRAAVRFSTETVAQSVLGLLSRSTASHRGEADGKGSPSIPPTRHSELDS